MKNIHKYLKKLLDSELGVIGFVFFGLNALYSLIGLTISFLLGPLGFFIPAGIGLLFSSLIVGPVLSERIKNKETNIIKESDFSNSSILEMEEVVTKNDNLISDKNKELSNDEAISFDANLENNHEKNKVKSKVIKFR